MNRIIALSLLCAATALPSMASAQASAYPVSTFPSTYVPLPIPGGQTPVVLPNMGSGNDNEVNVTLPFPFTFFGQTKTSAWIYENGWMGFGPGPQASDWVNSWDSAAPNDLIAGWWDDLDCAADGLKTQILGTAPSRQFVVQWHCFDLSGGSPASDMQFQVWLTEGSQSIQVRYGTMGTFTQTIDASFGIQDSTGSAAGTVQGIGARGVACGTACNQQDWPTATTVQYGFSTLPDLVAEARTGAMTTVGTDLRFPAEITIRNNGIPAASNVGYDVYLSSDAVLDIPGDDLLVSHPAVETVAGSGGTVTFSDLVTIPRPGPGSYWVCVNVDPADGVTESNNGNNRACSSSPFLVGSDLIGSISVPSTGAPGETVPFSVQVRNQGSDATGAFTYRIYLSQDNTLNALDTLVYTGTLSLQGTDAFVGTVSGLVPASIQGNPFYAILEIDPVSPAFPRGVVEEAVETNNRAISSGQITLIKPDLRIDSAVYDTETSLGCFFEEPVTVTYRICNQGGGNAWGFVNSVLFSTNIVITAPNPPQGDPEIDTIPSACFAQDSECGTAAGPGVCHLGICHNSCSTNADCSDGMVCAPERGDLAYFGKTCQNHLAPGECKTYKRTIDVPTANPYTGDPYVEKDDGYYFAVITDSSTSVNEEIEENNKIAIEPVAMCRFASPDLVAVTAIPPARMAAGETAAIFRTIRNLGNRSAEVGYRYILSTNESVSANDIPLVLQSTGADGVAQVGRNSENQATDLVRIPAHVAPGDYYLGLLVDPTNAVIELSDDNNSFITSTRVRIDTSALRIVTATLPDATVGAFYGRQLVAAGGAGTYQWSAKPTDLPPGITLSADGFLSGSALDEGTWAFTVNVTSGGVSTSAMLALRVGAPMGALAISTPASLPTGVIGQQHYLRLAAVGGQPPYRWERDSGELPRGLTITDGAVTGVPATAGTSTFTAKVTDAIGNSAKQQFTMTVVERDDLFITSQNFQEATAGEEFGGSDACVRAQGGSGQYTWFMDENTLPDGVTYETRDNRGCLVGTPLVCSSFTVDVRVEDTVTGQTDSAELPLNVVCSRVNLTTKRLPDVKRGETVDQQLTTNAGQGPSFRLFAGHLPAGLSLSLTGQLAGVVAADAAHGTYNFVVEITDQEGGYGLSGLAITVLADVKDVPKVKKDDGGCSTASDGASGVLPFAIALIGLVAAGLRRRVAAFARVASFATVIAVAGGAQAQADYVVTGPYDLRYEELVDPVNAPAAFNDDDWSTSSDQWIVELPTDFSFRFFGTSFGWLSVSGNGGIIPVNSSAPGTSNDFYVDTTNDALPNTSGPAGIIAPWWDDMARGGAASPHPGGLSYVIEGTRPNRVIKVQWKNLQHYACTASPSSNTYANCANQRSYSFQTWIYESKGTLDSSVVFSYATPIGPNGEPWGGEPSGYKGTSASSLPSATVGLENPAETIGLNGLTCNPNCTFDKDFPADKVIVFSKKADLSVTATRGQGIGWAGVSMPIEVEVKNLGSVAAGTFGVQYFGSADARLDARDIPLGMSTATRAAGPGASVLFSDEVTLPADILPGSYFVLAKADPARTVDEDVTVNNVGVYGPFVVGTPTPDVVVESVNAPAGADIGRTFTFDWAVRNRGNARAVDVPYAVVISDNDIISATDRRIATGLFSVDLLTVAPVSVDVSLPADVLPGRYYTGIVLDPDNVLHEISDLNNIGVSGSFFDANGGALTVVSGVLPTAQIGASYCVELVATGGNGDYTWTVANGSELPPGLSIVRESNRTSVLCGSPGRVGTFDFSVKVTSGDVSALGALSLEVSASTMPLTVASAELPMAVFNERYVATLLAVGGQAPYSWSIVAGELPFGLQLLADGSIRGTPAVDGTFGFTVQVVDAQENVATQTLDLGVTSPGRLSCVTSNLPSVMVGQPITGQILAAGGTKPYSFKSLETRRLSSGSDDGFTYFDSAPPGILMSGDGRISGSPSVAGSYLWLVEVEDGGRATDECLVKLEVTYEQGITILTRSLALATVGVPYSAQLEAAGGDGVLTWSVVPGSELPLGLDLRPDGSIRGVLTSELLAGEMERTFSFVVEVRDAQNRIGTTGLSIRLVEPAPPAPDENTDDDGGGCQAAGAAPGLFGVVVALGLASLRRRR